MHNSTEKCKKNLKIKKIWFQSKKSLIFSIFFKSWFFFQPCLLACICTSVKHWFILTLLNHIVGLWAASQDLFGPHQPSLYVYETFHCIGCWILFGDTKCSVCVCLTVSRFDIFRKFFSTFSKSSLSVSTPRYLCSMSEIYWSWYTQRTFWKCRISKHRCFY